MGVSWATYVNVLLEQLGLTPAEFAQRLGIGEPAVCKWRSGLNIPSAAFQEKLLVMGRLKHKKRQPKEVATTLTESLP